ncbi:MAG: hypothetical protein KH279_01515 [Collinsella intestinalis]|nr:hypothetical protein [Collinsella intestinalis]
MGSNFEMEPIIPMGWTFDEGIRASCDAFSIAIPDGYRIQECQDDDSEDIDVTFSAVPKANEDNETSFRIAIRIAENLPKDAFEEHGIDELAIAIFRKALNDDDNMLIPNSPEHWVAQGKNCSVLVTRIYSQFFGLFTRNSYLIRPISNDMSFRVEITMDEMNDDIAEAMRGPLDTLVSSIEITRPLESKLTKMLDKISTQNVTPQEFSETVNHLVKVVTLCKNTENTANQLEYLRNCDEPNGYDATRVVVMGMEDFLGRIFPMFVRTFDAIEFQRSFGCTEDELTSYFEVAKAMLEPCVTICDAIDRQSAQFLSEHGPIALPDGFWKIVDSIDMQLPETRSEMEMRIKAANEQFQAAIEEHINKAPNDNEESDGVDYPTLMMTLLSDDWFFFMDNEITWDGHHHAIAGAQLNGAKADELLDFVNSCIPGFDDVNEVFQYFVTLLNEIEKDEGLIVPRDMIAPGVQKAIREGDLTGLTLANLAACGKALCVQKAKAGSYRVIFDSRLIIGIPSFLDLVARLVWDLRQCTNSMRGKPFEISFLQARNIDADHYLGSVEAPVPGAQKYAMFMKVTEAPRIALPSASEAAEYQEQVSIELSPEDDMALNFVYALVRDFPCTKPISGTHHLGRAGRIDHVKVGDGLILAADWNCELFDPAGIEVFNEQGETLGYLEGVIGPMRGALALILPHVTATVESVTPLSKRKKGSKYALMDVHMELDDDATVEGILNVDPSSELLAQARGLLIRPKSERTVMSRANIDISQLKGRIDVSSFPQVESATSEVSHDETTAKTPSTADRTERQNNREAARTEYERLRNERRVAEEEAATAERIEQVRSAIEGFKEELQVRERSIRDATDAAYRAANDSFDRPARREALYRFYTAELERDLELTRLTRFLHAIDNMGLGPIDISSLPIEHGSATIGPLLKETESYVSDYADRLVRISENRKNDKFWAFKKPYRDRILEHLIETGEDLTRQQIEEDLDETEGLYWNPPEGPGLKLVDFEAFLRNIPSPGPDTVSQLHYRRMLMDESHGAQKEISRLMAEIEQWEEMLSGDLEFTKSERSALETEIKALQDRIVQAESLAEMAEDRERNYLKHRALFYIKDQATVIPQNAEIERAAFLATRPVAKPEKTEPAKSNVPTDSAQPSEKPNTAAAPAATAASDVTANTSGNAAGGLILPIAAVIGFVGGCIYGGPFPGFLLAAFTTISAWITINELKK